MSRPNNYTRFNTINLYLFRKTTRTAEIYRPKIIKLLNLIFSRLDETCEMPRIQFSGTKGLEHEQTYMKIEQRFHKLLVWVCGITSKILDVRQSIWHDDMSYLRSEIKFLEITMENLMEETFKECRNIEDALHTIHAFRYFKNRENLQKQFDKKTNFVSSKLIAFLIEFKINSRRVLSMLYE